MSQNGYHEVGRNRKFIVMRKSRTNGKPDIQTSTIMVSNTALIAPDLISIISRKSGIPLDKFT